MTSLLLGCVLLFAPPAYADAETVEADILNNAGITIGSVTVEQTTQGVLVDLQAEAMPPGYHGMHFHAVGGLFLTLLPSNLPEAMSTPLILPTGSAIPNGPHEGNLPNLVVAADGTVEVELYSDLVTLTEGPGPAAG